MVMKKISELTGNEILARAIMTSDFQIILSEGVTIKLEYVKKLQELGIDSVYIKEEAPEEIAILKSDIENIAKSKVKEILEQHTYSHNEELVQLCDTADSIIANIINEEKVMEQVYDIKQRSADIFEHSTNLCTLSIMTGLKLGLSKNLIRDIGIACLLHDIGLRYLTINFDNQDIEQFSKADMVEFMKHPVYGYSALKNENWISDRSKNIILYHHEKIDGSGYPFHTTTIPLAVSVVSVCDSFDEMICGIGCKKVKVNEAVEYLRTFRNIKFDEKVVDALLGFTAVYPVGTRVVTNYGEVAIVVRQNKGFVDRPVIQIVKDKNGNGVVGDIFKDLLEIHYLFIDKVI